MEVAKKYFKGSISPKNAIDTIKYVNEFNKEHPFYFKPEGITIFTGAQGQGKTLSAVQLCKKLLDDYPKACFCTNLHIKGVLNETFNFNDLDDIENVKNGEYGVVFFIDEIQNYLNSLQSKQIPLSTIVQLTQARKQRKIIIGTSQVYSRMAKPLREQVRNVVLCHKLFGFLQYNELIDSIETKEDSSGKLKPVIKDRFIFFHTPSLYNAYDTFKVSYGITKKVKENNIVVLDNNNYMEM